MPNPEDEDRFILCHFVNDDVGPNGAKLTGSGNSPKAAPPRKYGQAVTD